VGGSIGVGVGQAPRFVVAAILPPPSVATHKLNVPCGQEREVAPGSAVRAAGCHAGVVVAGAALVTTSPLAATPTHSVSEGHEMAASECGASAATGAVHVGGGDASAVLTRIAAHAATTLMAIVARPDRRPRPNLMSPMVKLLPFSVPLSRSP
jgi:hypothetical protein